MIGIQMAKTQILAPNKPKIRTKVVFQLSILAVNISAQQPVTVNRVHDQHLLWYQHL